jgi:NADPH2:quinone reductase
MTATMKAAVTGEQGLQLREVPRPAPKPNEVLVRVRFCGLNRADVLRAGRAKPGEITIPGMDWSGEAVEVGKEVKGIKPGDRVMCSGSGGYAEYAVTDWGRVLPVPRDRTLEQAATLPVALTTMHDALMTNGRLRPGESVLIQGASSGVGLMGLQIARLGGAQPVIGTSTHPSRRARLADFGADLALDSNDPAWVEAARRATGGSGVDVIVDQVSGKLVNQNVQAAAILGRIVNVGRLGGNTAEFDFNQHALRRITYVGVTFRTRSVDEVREVARKMRADLWDALESGKLALPIDRVFPLAEAEAAQVHMRANAHFGKILLRVAG